MTELQAALGLSQLKRLDDFVNKRNTLAQVYNQAFKESPLNCLSPKGDTFSAYHLYIVLLPQRHKKSHQHIISSLRASNICAHVHYIPIHLQPYYQQNRAYKMGHVINIHLRKRHVKFIVIHFILKYN